MKRIIFLILTCFAVNANAQTITEIYSNDTLKVHQFTGSPASFTGIINNKDDDTIWVHCSDNQNAANNRIISLNKDLDIISNTHTNYFPLIEHKINDKFYELYYKYADFHQDTFTVNIDLDTLLFRCFDRNGNDLINKILWIKNDEDTLWINTEQAFKYRRLSNNNFLLVANAKYPSNIDQSGSDALKLILFDTLGNILKTKTYPLKSLLTETRICEVGEHFILEKVPILTLPNEYFTYRGISYINKETLEIEDSIPRGPFVDTLPNGIICESNHLSNIIAINDTTFAGLFQTCGRIKIHIFNKNNKEIIHIMNVPTSTNIDTERNYDHNFDRFAFNNTDSIYTHYVDNGSLTLLNFSASGNINFQYKLSFPSDYYKTNEVRGMKMTENGGVIIGTWSLIKPYYGCASWLIKFHPKGLIGLTNIETKEKETINLYPNPARDYVCVDIEATNFSNAEIELFDMQGKLVKRAKLSAKHGNRVDVSNLNAGAYSYNVSLNGKTISGKVIVGK